MLDQQVPSQSQSVQHCCLIGTRPFSNVRMQAKRGPYQHYKMKLLFWRVTNMVSLKMVKRKFSNKSRGRVARSIAAVAAVGGYIPNATNGDQPVTASCWCC